ncbi:unnamed protein product [Colias eurytheme]|nr:unnamed protein product [Colias eurytheme]
MKMQFFFSNAIQSTLQNKRVITQPPNASKCPAKVEEHKRRGAIVFFLSSASPRRRVTAVTRVIRAAASPRNRFFCEQIGPSDPPFVYNG